MKSFTTIILLLIGLNVNATEGKELKTSIKSATVFLQGAQVTRTGQIAIPIGKSTLIMKSLTPYMDAKSIIVKANGDFTVLSVNHKLNYLNQLDLDSEIRRFKDEINRIQRQINVKETRLSILKEKETILNANKMHVNEEANLDLGELKNKIEFYDQELTKIKTEESQIKEEIEKLNVEVRKHKIEIKNLNDQSDQPTGEIYISVASEIATKASFEISYFTENAGWFPSYDIRVKDVASPIALNYKAELFQNTGIDWENVKLRFSNADPNQSGLVPTLETWYLNVARNTIVKNKIPGYSDTNIRKVKGRVMERDNGEPLPGVNIIVKGSTVGTVTDMDGRYELNLPNNAKALNFSFIGMVPVEVAINNSVIDVSMEQEQMELQEVVVTGYAYGAISNRSRSAAPRKEAKKIITTTIQNQTTVEFEVKRPYSLKSGGKSISIDLKQLKIEASFQYFAVPKVDKDAFLMASIVNWDQYNLLEGEANLYFEDAYVGRTVLEANSLVDTLNVSLGRDRGLVVGRKKEEEYMKRKTIGSNIIETKAFRIIARNKKSQAVKLTIFDQLPVAAINSISINPIELSKANHDEKSGKLSWSIELPANDQRELELSYQVKYPKYEQVYLE